MVFGRFTGHVGLDRFSQEVPKTAKDGRVEDLKTWETMLQRCQQEAQWFRGQRGQGSSDWNPD